MTIVDEPQISELETVEKTAHQIRRHKRLVEENKAAHQANFGRRKEFGKRTRTITATTRPRRIFGVFKAGA